VRRAIPAKTARARELRNHATEAERRLWVLLNRRQAAGFRFRRQQPIGPYTLDFYCPEIRLAIELDGGQHAEKRAEHDALRTEYLEAEGVTVLRFWNWEIFKHLDGVTRTIFDEAYCAAGRAGIPMPAPPPDRSRKARAARKAATERGDEAPPAPPLRGGEYINTVGAIPPHEVGGEGGLSHRAPLPEFGVVSRETIEISSSYDNASTPERVEEAPPTPPLRGGEQTAPPLRGGEQQTEFAPEVLARLERFDALLLAESASHNLISQASIADRSERHYRDSAQLYELIPKQAKTLVDLGSGAGFPGLVLAAMGAARGLKVILVESTQKKARFLREAAAVMNLTNVTVMAARIEALTLAPPDVITARALAPLPKLLDFAHAIAGDRTLMLFPKGQDVEGELADAAKSWAFHVKRHASATSPGSVILAINGLRRKRGPRA